MRKFLLIALSLLLAGCTVEKIDEHLVVDGWIEDGGYPVVILTSSVAVVEGTLDYEQLSDHVLRWATVTLSDGEQTVPLTGMMDERYFPPYIYTTSSMKGQAGKSYTLNIKYGKTEASAVTTVPAPQTLTKIEPLESKDGALITVGFTPQEGSYYGFFTKREGKDSTYLMSTYSLVEGSAIPADYESTIFRGFDVMGPGFAWNFEHGDHVSVRFSTMDAVSYNYWKGLFDEWVFSRNPFFPVRATPASNVVGGYGCWAGYGSTFYEIDIP